LCVRRVASGLFSLHVGAFVLGLVVIGVLRHNADASGSRGRWLWSVAWILTWGALGALSLALGWGRWLAYGALAIAFISLMGLVPGREVHMEPDGGDSATVDRGRELTPRWWADSIGVGLVVTTCALVIAADLLPGVELTWQGLIVAVAVIEGVGVAAVAAGKALLVPYADVPDEETSLGRGALGMGAMFFGVGGSWCPCRLRRR